MIIISQRPQKKCAGTSSLWIKFDYQPQIVEVIKLAENVVYYKDTKEWECPLNKLSYLIDSLTFYDQIKLKLLPDKKYEDQLEPKIQHTISPFPYQQEGIKWLINRDGGLLLDCAGLGKTLQVIYQAEELKLQRGIKHCLIICGVNSLKQNWKKEIHKFSNEPCRIIGERVTKTGKLKYQKIKERAEELYNPISEFFVIMNIESFQDDLVLEQIRSSQNNFDMVVVDECHKIKNPQATRQKQLLKQTKNIKLKYALTGTLIINNPLDCFVPMKFVGQNNSSWTNFKQFYCNISQKFGHYQIDGYKNIDILKEELNNISLRRTKDLLKDLPPKMIIPQYVEMEEGQQKFYDELQSGVVKEADRVNIKTTSLLGLVTRLRQAASSPHSLTSSSQVTSCKIDRAVDLIEEITSNGDKVVIFSTFKDPIYELKNKVEQDVLICTGDQSEQEISDNVDKFQSDPKYQVLICTPQKLGTGFTLTQASYGIFLDSNFTYSLESQSEDRLHRIGSSGTVFIYKLIARGTIDERIQNILERKRQISEYMEDDQEENQTEEIRELLGIQ